MKKDKIKIYIFESLICLIFFFTLFVSSVYLRVIIASILLLSLFIIKRFLHKRNIVSLYHKQVTFLLGLLSILFLLVFYILGLYFGYATSLIKFSLATLLLIVVPTTIIIITSEIIRSIFLVEKSIISKILITLAMVLIDVSLYTNINQIITFTGFTNIISFSVFASIASNLLWNYTSIRYGYKPAIIFRLIFTLYEFIIPIIPNIFIYFRCFLRIIYPYIIYIILEMLYSRKEVVVAVKARRRDNIITVILLTIMIVIIMLVSCEFKYGLLVIGTGSMKGTIDIGDAILYESYEGQNIKEEQVIVFERDNMKVVHRVIDIKEVNGIKRYYTKGDANTRKDTGYITSEEIIGFVKFKIKYIGYPTLALQRFF